MAVRKKPSTEAFRTEDCISNLEDLVFLALAGNQFSGSLPNSWSLAEATLVSFAGDPGLPLTCLWVLLQLVELHRGYVYMKYDDGCIERIEFQAWGGF